MTSKKVGPDLVKALAIFSVFGVHFILNTMDNVKITGNTEELIYFSYRQIFIVCVPLFILTTGYLNSHKVVDHTYFKKIIPLLKIYLFYSLLSLLFRYVVLQEEMSWIEGIYQVLNFKGTPYAWYINMYLGLFLLSPFINKIITHSSRKEIDTFLFILLLLTVFPLTFNVYTSSLFSSAGSIFPDFWTSCYPLTYYVLGARLKKYPFTGKKFPLLVLSILAGLISVTLSIYFSHSGILSKVTKEYGNLFTVIQSTIWFILLIDSDFPSGKYSFISFVSSHTLPIYLISYVTDQIVYKTFGRYWLESNYRDFLLSPVFVLTSFLLSSGIVYIFKLIKTVPLLFKKT